MIELRIRELRGVMSILSKIAKSELPIVLSYKIAKIIRALNAEIPAVDSANKELLSRYGKLDKDGRYIYHADGTLDVEQALQEDYDREFKELMDTCITIPCEKISIDALERNGIRLSPIEVMTIEGLLME